MKKGVRSETIAPLPQRVPVVIFCAYPRRMSRPRIATIKLDGCTSRVFSSTTSSHAKPPVFILLHGIGMSHRYLTRLHAELAAIGDTHSIDLPGFGTNPKPPWPPSVELFAAVVGQVLDQLGVDSCTVIGHSMGSQFGIELARQRPALVSHLVLMGPVVDPRRRTVWQQALALARDSLRERPSVNFIVLTDYLRCGPRWFLKVLPAMLDYSTEEKIPDVSVPVLLLRGESDPIAGRELCLNLAARAQKGVAVEIPRERHVVQQSAPKRVSFAIAAFVGRTVAREAES